MARKNRRKHNNGSGLSMSAYDHDDVIIFDEEEWEEVIAEEEDEYEEYQGDGE